MKKNRLVNFVFMMFFLIGCSPTVEVKIAKEQLGPGQHEQFFQKTITKNLSCNYLLYLPKDYGQEEKQWPMILFLHGSGQRGNDLRLVEQSTLPANLKNHENFPFIVVSPQCPDGSRWGKQHEVLKNLLDEITDRYDVDESRIYLTGLSMGGYGSWSLGIEYPERFAAIAPIAGGFSAHKLKNVPIWAFHGAKDSFVPLEKSQIMVDAVKKAGGNARLTIYPTLGHGSWSTTYVNPQLYEWFLRHRRQKDGKISIQESILDKKKLKELLFFDYFREAQVFTEIKTADAWNELEFSLEIENPLTVDVDVQVEWEKAPTSLWIITSEPERLLIGPGGKKLIRFKAHIDGEENFLPLPVCKAKLAAMQRTEEARLLLPIDLDPYLRKHRPTLVARQCESAPTIDGKIDDTVWQRKADASEFSDLDLTRSASVRTEGWVCYDNDYCYIAMRCYEPLVDMLKADISKRDGSVFEDDSIEIFLDTNRDRETYYQFVVNSAAVVYDASGFDKSYNADIKAAVSKDDEGWNVELAIPWADINVQTPFISNAKMGFLFVRTRQAKQGRDTQILQYPPLNGRNHRKEYFGNLDME